MQRDELKRILMELVEEETGEPCPELDDSTDLRQGLHLDSLDMVGVIFRIESRLQVEVDSEQLGQLVTVGDLLNLLQQKVASSLGLRAA